MRRCNALGPILGWAAHMAKSSMDNRMAQYEITAAQNRVLMYLHHLEKPAPQCEVAEHLRVKPSTANGILDRMVDKGLVERTVSGQDALRRLISITEKGIAQCERTKEEFRAVEEQLVRGFTPEEEALLRRLLGRIIENLEEGQTC